jgi:flagellar basal-body rod protein FlgF
MNYGLYLAAGGLQVAEYRQGVIANNLANAETVGFKRDLAAVMARPQATDEDPALAALQDPTTALLGGGTFAAPNEIDLTQASLKSTKAPLDLGLEGKGFFTVQGTDGKSYLTRDGRFTMNTAGTLVNADGRPVLNDAGSPITLNAAKDVTVDPSGRIAQNGTVVGTLGIVNPKDASQLRKVGNNLLTVDDASTLTPATSAQVRQGAVEASGVDPSIEMVNMIENQRIYDANAKQIQAYDRLAQTANQVGRVG